MNENTKKLLHTWNNEMKSVNRGTIDMAYAIQGLSAEALKNLSEEESEIFKKAILFLSIYGNDFSH